MEKETFKSCAETAGIIAKEVAVATTVSGLAMFGSTMTTVVMGMAAKHPILGTICSALSASIVSGMVMGNEKLQDWILDDAEDEADRLTDLIYGSKDEVTED